MIEKVRAYCEKNQMIEKGDIIVAGVSGGADSVCLLHVLTELKKQLDFSIVIVHVNHGVRQEAAEDAAYVQSLCRAAELPFVLVEKNVPALAEEWKLSEEEAGRKVRYDAFEEVIEEWKQKNPAANYKIAVAHNSNDRAETVLHNLFRGSGILGLTGIKPVRGNIIRPLLETERWEIEEFLKNREISFCIDRTNLEDNYTRNRIRHHIMEYAEKEVSRKAVKHINHAADMLSETEQYLEKQTKDAYARCVKNYMYAEKAQQQANSYKVSVSAFSKEELILQKRIILQIFEDITATRKDITSTHVEEVLGLFKKDGEKELYLPYGIHVKKQYDNVFFYQEWEKQEQCLFKNAKVLPPCIIEVDGLGTLEFTVFPMTKMENVPEKTYTKWFDYDKIVEPLELRTRKIGDYLCINQQMGKKTIKEYMIQEKIPRSRRDSMVLLAEGSHILWIPGFRISEKYKITVNTRRVLEVQLRGGTQNGRTC